MRRSPTALLSAVLMLTATLPVFPQQLSLEQAVDIPSARTAAIGGVHVALADDITTLFSNPAGFQTAGPQMSLAELALGLAGPIFDMATVVSQLQVNSDPVSLISSSSVQHLLKNLYAAGILNGPFAFGYVGDGLGFGLFNKSRVVFSTSGAIPVVSAQFEEDIIFTGGYAFSIPLPPAAKSTLDIGLMLKTEVQGTVALSKSILDILALFTPPNSPTADLILSQPFRLTIGAGLDLGVRYSWNNLLTIGIVGRNLPTLTLIDSYPSLTSFTISTAPQQSYGYVPIDLSAGIMFSPGLGFLDRYISHLKLFLDYNDILDFLTHPDTAMNPILHVGIGAEVTILEILSLRGGFYNGYFSAGLGMDLTIFRLDLAMFGRELSLEPALRPVYNLLIGIEFRL
jgi:hypothetical protein